MNPQQVLPGSKVSLESHALRDLEARWTLRSIALLPLPGRSWLSCTPKSQPSKKQIADFAHGPGLPNTEIFELLRAESTVHDDVLARGECRPGRTEPEDGAGNLLGRSDAANRGLCHNRFFHLGLPFAEGPVEHFSLDRAGRHTIDADALSSKLQRSRLGKADDSELAGGINRRARKPRWPAREELLTMAPPPDRSMAGISCFIDNRTPRMLMSQT